MLSIKEEKHLLYFDKDKQLFSSFLLYIKDHHQLYYKAQKKQDLNDSNQSIISLTESISYQSSSRKSHQKEFDSISISIQSLSRFEMTFSILNSFSYKFQSEYYQLNILQQWGSRPKFHRIPLSLETYFNLYLNPKHWKIEFVLKDKYKIKQPQSVLQQAQLIDKIFKSQDGIGKLIITSSFSHFGKGKPFKLPIFIINQKRNINVQASKIVKIVTLESDSDEVICSGKRLNTQIFEKIENFKLSKSESDNFKIDSYEIEPRINTEHICILKDKLNCLQFEYNRISIKIMSPSKPIFIQSLLKILQSLSSLFIITPIIIVQNVQSPNIYEESYHGIVFQNDILSLHKQIMKSYLYDRVQDKWLIEGIIDFNSDKKSFQDCLSQLENLMLSGEELFPLNQEEYYFDDIWKIKAKFLYRILANFKSARDVGSSSLAKLILDYSKKRKITSTYLFRKLKYKYGISGSLRNIYEEQFIKCTGLNKIFYQMIDLQKQNQVQFIIRQKSLSNKFFKTYNLFRIKLEEFYHCQSSMMDMVAQKNKFYNSKSNTKDLTCQLAVPQFLKCLPYIKGKVTIESDACSPFEFEIVEENIVIKTRQISTLKGKPNRRQAAQNPNDELINGFSWMMMDTSHMFPALYKNQNIKQATIIQKIKVTSQWEQQQLDYLNSISERDHSDNKQICEILMQKLKMKSVLINTSTTVKRKILQIIPSFMNKANDYSIWEAYYNLFKLYEPPCFDQSEEGFLYLLSLMESATKLIYRKQFSYYYKLNSQNTLRNSSSFRTIYRIIKLKINSTQMPAI